MTDADIMQMVIRNMRGALDHTGERVGLSPHMAALWREVANVTAGESPEIAAEFRARVDRALGMWLDAMSELLETVPDSNVSPHQLAPSRARRVGSSYVSRTVTRAVIWNAVGSIFRAFR